MVLFCRHEGRRHPYGAAARTGLIALFVIAFAAEFYVWLAPKQPDLASPEQFARTEQAHHAEPYDCNPNPRLRTLSNTLGKDQVRAEHCARGREEDLHEQESRWQAIRTAQATEQAAIEAQRQAVASAASVAILIIALSASIWAARAASRAAKSADETLDHAQRTADQELRAYVFPGNIKAVVIPFSDGTNFLTTVEIPFVNRGKTPAKHVRSDINAAIIRGNIPVDFDFPEAVIGGTIGHPLGPGQATGASIHPEPEEVGKLLNREGRMFIWAWIEYRDTLPNSPPRRTEVCVEVEASADKGDVVFRTQPVFNAHDEDCYRQPKVG